MGRGRGALKETTPLELVGLEERRTERGERECDGTVGGEGNSRTGEMEEGVEGGSVMLAVTASLLLSRQPSFSALGIG